MVRIWALVTWTFLDIPNYSLHTPVRNVKGTDIRQRSQEHKNKTIPCFLDMFIYSLFNDGYSVTHTTQRRMKWWLVNNKWEMMWKKLIVDWWIINGIWCGRNWSLPTLRLYRNFLRETEENHEELWIAVLHAEIWTRGLKNTKQVC
jgi:hypothetical protein